MKSNHIIEPQTGAGRREPLVALWPNRFPEDLRVWLKSPALLRLAHSVAQEHTASTLRPVFLLTARRFHHPWRMLTLLTYAFASGIWHSRAIAEIAALDLNLVTLCHGESPSAEIIRRFRNQNRVQIVKCLELLLRRLWCHQQGPRAGALHELLSVEILCDARMRLQRAELSESLENANASTTA